MTSRRETGLYQTFLSAQLLVMVLCYAVCFAAVLFLVHDGTSAWGAYVKYLLVILAALTFEGIGRPGRLRCQVARSRRAAWSVTVRQSFAMVTALLVLLVFSRDLRISRTFLAVLMVASTTVIFLTNRYGFRLLINYLGTRTDSWALKTAILGPPDWCRTVSAHLRSMGSSYDIRAVAEIPIHADIEEVDARLTTRDFDLLVAAAFYLKPETTATLMRRGERHGYRTWLPVELSRQLGSRFEVERIGQMDVLTPPAEPLENTLNGALKRSFDLGVAALVSLLILPPLMLFVKLLQSLYSPGPLFFRQERMGINNRTFEVLKFRTMRVDNDDESRQASANDDRVYRGGGLLRKLSLDEFPQFLNVLQGHMSIVGPRPHMVCHEHEFQEYFERYGLRRYVKPGITGLAQVRGFRGEVTGRKDIRGRARYDVLYVRRWSLLLDVRLVFATALFVIKPHSNAY